MRIAKGKYDHPKTKRIFTMTSYDFCIFAPNLKLEMTIYVNCNYDPIQQLKFFVAQ